MAGPLQDILFSYDDRQAYAVVDGASCEELLDKLDEFQPEHVCLYAGELEPDVAEVAPYLVRLEPDAEFTRWLLQEGWGRHWGIYFLAPVDLRAMRKHLRTFLLVRDPTDQTLYFRYYDPRVIRLYLPTCEPEEVRQVFGPATVLFAEDENPAVALRWDHEDGVAALRRVIVEH